MAFCDKNIKIIPEKSQIVITTENGLYPVEEVVCPVENMEFKYNDNVYVIYVNTLNVRRHERSYKILNKQINEYSIISKTDAEDMIIIFSNLFKIVDLGISTNMTCKEAFYKYLDKISSINTKSNEVQTIKNNLYESLSRIDDEQLRLILDVSGSKPVKFEYTNVSSCMKIIREYIISIITYDPRFANHRNLSMLFDLLLGTVGVVINVMSTFTQYYISLDDVILHETGILLENGIFDRTSYHLYIQGDNQMAATIKNMMEMRYPILKMIQNESDLSKIDESMQNQMLRENEEHNINLFPYMMFYRLSDVSRMKMNIKTYYESSKINGMFKNNQSLVAFQNAVLNSYNKLTKITETPESYETYSHELILEIFNILGDYMGMTQITS